jgi:hypothetical protein
MLLLRSIVLRLGIFPPHCPQWSQLARHTVAFTAILLAAFMLIAGGTAEWATVHAVAARDPANPATFTVSFGLKTPGVLQAADSQTSTLTDEPSAVRVLYLVPKNKQPRPRVCSCDQTCHSKRTGVVSTRTRL